VNPVLITADRLFDGTTAVPMVRPTVRASAGRIEAISPEADCPAHGEDFPGCTILPGLIDTHVHLVFAALSSNAAVIEQVTRETDEQLFERACANAAAALRSGITTLRDCGGKGRIVQAVRDAIARGDAAGPEILSCGMPITTTLGHCHWLGLVADGHDDASRAADRMLAEGADFLKVMATGGNMTPTSDPMRAQYDDATLKAIADRGRAAGKHAAAHVLSRAALPGAVAANVRTIEHCDWRVSEDRYAFDPELARRMIDQGQFAGLTMSGIARRAFLPEVRDDSGPVRRLDARFTCERAMIDFGVPFTLHSDAGVRATPVDRFALGLRSAVVELRLTPAEALRAATATAAEAIGLHDRGKLEAGRRADVLVVDGDPLADLACLERVRAVFKSGRRIL
jgi:imidazolonepropionase-like amidohydrolase